MTDMVNCPCGSEKLYQECCGKFHKKLELASTAEELMRSRYSAFVKHEIDYILDTHHKDTVGDIDRSSVEQWAKDSHWNKLEILDVDEPNLKIEFKAHYRAEGKNVVHHERAIFKKEDDRLYFYDSEQTPVRQRVSGPKVGRNDPCPCGSGKKYKKCCL